MGTIRFQKIRSALRRRIPVKTARHPRDAPCPCPILRLHDYLVRGLSPRKLCTMTGTLRMSRTVVWCRLHSRDLTLWVWSPVAVPDLQLFPPSHRFRSSQGQFCQEAQHFKSRVGAERYVFICPTPFDVSLLSDRHPNSSTLILQGTSNNCQFVAPRRRKSNVTNGLWIPIFTGMTFLEVPSSYRGTLHSIPISTALSTYFTKESPLKVGSCRVLRAIWQ